MAAKKLAIKKLSSFGERIGKVFKTIKSDTFHAGFHHIDMWVSTGVYALNRLLSNSYDKGFLFGRVVTVYGEPGSGKSLLLAQTAGIAQRNLGAYIIWVDVEHATDDTAGKEWLTRAGVDIENNFQYLSLITVPDAQKLISDTIAMYRADVKAAEEEDGASPPPMVIVFDSLSTLQPASQWEKAVKGEVVGDQGQRAQQIGNLVLKANHLLTGLPILVAGVLHVFDNQEMINGRPIGGKHKLTGGKKVAYMSSQALLLTLKKLQAGAADTVDTKGMNEADKRKVVGIESIAQIIKSRFSKPFEGVGIQIPWDTGIDPLSGLFDIFVMDGVLTSPTKGWYQFVRADKTVVKFQRKSFSFYADELRALPVDATTKGVGLAIGDEDEPTDAESDAEELV